MKDCKVKTYSPFLKYSLSPQYSQVESSDDFIFLIPQCVQTIAFLFLLSI